MAITLRRLTVDDLEAIPEEHEGDRQELIYGELVVSPPPVLRHQIISGNIYSAIDRLVRDSELGTLFHPPTGVRFAADSLLIPDICFVARDRRDVMGVKTIDIPPDLVVEILSPGTRRRDLNDKCELYARFGVREYWIVDPDKRSVTVLTLVDGVYEPVPAGEGSAVRSLVLPHLALTPDAVFKSA